MTTRTLTAPKHMARITNKATKKPYRVFRTTARDTMGNVAAFEIETGIQNDEGKKVEVKAIDTYTADFRVEGDGFVCVVEKQGGDRPYCVRISEATGNSCECDGWKWGGKCRHVSGLLALAASDAQKPLACRGDAYDCHDAE